MKHLLGLILLLGLAGCATDGESPRSNPPPGVGAYQDPPNTNPVQQGSSF